MSALAARFALIREHEYTSSFDLAHQFSSFVLEQLLTDIVA